MSFVRRAVIDVGTNSVKLLVAEVAGRDVRPIHEDSKQTRLGSGFYETHRLQSEPIAKTARAVARFAEIAHGMNASPIRVIATSAARDAVNPDELISAIETASGLRVEIISGDQEADWAFQGVTSDPQLATQPLLLLDVGGGSTEFILGSSGKKLFGESLPLGTVRLLEKIPHSNPPTSAELAACRAWLKSFLQSELRPRLEPAMRELKLPTAPALQLVGTGGTTSILARIENQLEEFDRIRIEGTRLPHERLRWQVERLWSLPLEERQQIVGLPKKRADVILTGAAIYEAVMDQFGFAELRVSTRGLRYAAVMDE
ncbi:MAG: exopolyphosphatase / guanosine-5-triphosphate,3-diphosphate pyrophosphatase [Verrucomicrobiota bacterium]|jgi:exopolyphosphatase/guanosine-5'-triphosphate,3'-diphosphate pyrophosphatase